VETIDDLLAKTPFFQGLSADDLKLIAGCASNVHFAAGALIVGESQEADYFYVIRRGTAAIEVHVPERGPVLIQTLGPSDILGWSWLFPPYRWRFDVRARDEISATAFDGACLRMKCDERPALGYELMKRLAHVISQRLDGMRLQMLDLYGPSNG
jgi:CRP-like cAMP-binding protein